MILYALACDAGHRFDSWFRDAAAYDAQAARGDIACPACGSRSVAKTVMAPALAGARKREAAPPEAARPDVALLDQHSRNVRAILASVRDKVLAEADDVGARFPQEARRMHEGEIPTRKIFGQASPGEARELVEDGIHVMPLPIVPDELN